MQMNIAPMTTSPAVVSLLDAALAYARHGWPVFPLVPQSKNPLTANGFKDARLDPAIITDWWTRHPDANIGVPTGALTGITVLDVDIKPWKNVHGDVTLAALLAEHGALPPTLEQVTWSGGTQYVFTYVPGMRNSSGKLGHGLDIRGDGGYIVAPPSRVHQDGREGRYEWRTLLPLQDMPLALMPEWIIARLRKPDQRPLPETTSSLPEAAASAAIPHGERNTGLTSLAGSMRRRGMSEEAMLAALTVENEQRCQPPLPEAEVRRIARSIASYPPADEAPNLTDYGNARRLVLAHGDDIRYVPVWKRWLVWDGRRWALDETCEIHRRAKDTVRRMYAEAATLGEKAREALAKHAAKSESEQRIVSMIGLARSEAEVVVTPEGLDADHWVLNCGNGTVDLRTGDLRAHDRRDYITKLAPVEYDRAACCPTWDNFLAQILSDDAGLIRYVQKVIGYALTGSTAEQCFFIAYGVGANGKSTLFKTVATMLGDYAKNTRSQTILMKPSGGGATPEVARLHGARFVLAVEAEAGRQLAEGLVKGLTGGDRVVARRLYQDEFEFDPTFKLFLAVNHRPVIKGTDHGVWRRIRLIPFDVTIPDSQQDKDLANRLRDELPGILRWAVEGCLAYQREHLGMPPAVTQATEEYRAESDVLAEFLTEECVTRTGLMETSQALYESYERWCARAGEHAISRKAFGTSLRERGYESKRREAGNMWVGISLRGTSTAEG
jgi:putative DNA primase/helicase